MKDALIKNRSFYAGKRVFVTGHTGFKGAWLTAILHELGAETTGYALAPAEGSLFQKMDGASMLHNVEGDVRDYEALERALLAARPEIVIHFAAQMVKDCFEQPRYGFETNVMGTVNLLEAVRLCPEVKSVVVVTTDKVYENHGDGAVYRETDPLGGEGPYSGSKTCVEFVTRAYKRSYLQTENRTVGISTARASNVLGGGDHMTSRLIPSILNAIAAGKPVELRHPHQTRPWQSVLDALNGYLTIGRYMYEDPLSYSGEWNIGPTQDGIRDVLWVLEKIKHYFAETNFVEGPSFGMQESRTLGLDISKALEKLDWAPHLTSDEMIWNVVDFFKQQRSGVPEREILQRQIRDFFEIEA